MRFQELIILLPCHSLEDFPTYHEGEDAQSLLASWSALWHPELMAAAGQAPTWRRIEDPPSEIKDRLIVVPSVCAQRLPTGFPQRVKEEGGLLIRKTGSREEIVEAALGGLREGEVPAEPRNATEGVPYSADLAADFLALGYCYLQIQLLTRQMRYSSNLDETYFKGQAVAAAVAVVEGNEALAREKLSACFSVLAEERDHYYPVDAFIIELNLLATTTLGEDLKNELSCETPTSVLGSADLLEEMAAKHPDSFAALKSGLDAGRVGLIGGEATENRLPLLSHETILTELRRGLAKYERLLGRRPEVYGRWRYGLTPHLPGILHRLGFRGAIHTTFEDGKTPDGLQFKVRWEGLEGSAIDAIARTPLDASKPQTFLSLATKMGESMDTDHVATLCLAHWPGQGSTWLDDLRRISRYSAALGKFVTIDQYFRETEQPGQLDRFEADRYRSPYLKQAVIRKQPDPISSQVRYWQDQAANAVLQSIQTMAVAVRGTASGESPDTAESPAPSNPELISADQRADETLSTAASQLASALTTASAGKSTGVLVINPCSFVRRLGVEATGLTGLPTIEKPVYSADESDRGKQVVVDVPGMGFVHVSPGKASPRDRKTLLLVEENVLRNEFFEAVINPTTGSLAAIHEYSSRGNRMSQQLAMRMPGPKQKPGDTFRDPDESAFYSVMAADSIETTISTTTLGEIVTRGRLLDQEGNKLAGFVQTYRLWKGCRVLSIDIELDAVEEPKADPWNSYYCCRFAWADELAELYRTVNMTRQTITEKRFEAPHYIEISDEKHSTTILTGGLPFHRRQEHRMLDSLLITRGESGRRFRIGIGVDLNHPLHDALGILSPQIVVPGAAQPASGGAGWLFHLSSRNVITTSLSPLVEGTRVAGFRARLLETGGRPAKLMVTALHSVETARTVDFLGNQLSELKIEEGKVQLEMAPHEWVEVEARW